jgi:hypothetical protein
VKLTIDEKKAIRRGDSTALRRHKRPDVKVGDEFVLAYTGGRRQFVGRTEEERKANKGETIEIPRRKTLWITVKAPPRLRDGVEEWLIEFDLHDERQPVRRLSATPGPRGEPGLKTRWRDPDHVPKKGEQKESWTSESERGYGGAKSIDEVEGVDDATLDEFARRIEEENALRRSRDKQMGVKLAEEARLARTYRKGGKPQAVTAIKRRIERAEKRLRRAA